MTAKRNKVILPKHDKNECFVLRRSIIYLANMLDRDAISDKRTLEGLAWVLGHRFKKLEKHLFKIISPKVREKFAFDFGDTTDTDKSITLIQKILFKSSENLKAGFLQFIREELQLRHESLRYQGKCGTENKIAELAAMFSLSDGEIEFCTFLFIATAWKNAEDHFLNHLKCNAVSGRRYLKAALQLTDREIDEILTGTLTISGFCEIKKGGFKATEVFEEYFLKPSNEESASGYFRRINPKSIESAKHQVDRNRTSHIIKLLGAEKKSPAHILLHGKSGTGKKSYAYHLAKTLGMPVYEITPNENDVNYRASVKACLNSIRNNEKSLVIVGRADQILKTKESWSSRYDTSTRDRKWINQLLEEQGHRMIWITNSIDEIDDSVIQRFSFNMHFKQLNRKQRAEIWESVLCRHHVERCFNEHEIKELSGSYPLAAAIIDSSVRKALDIASPADRYFKDTVKMNLDAYMELTRKKDKPANRNNIENSYSIEGLNVDGDLDTMMTQLEAYDRYLREDDNGSMRNFNLLFYGHPGTGKSELARYIAYHLGREIICERTSDIVTPYVGETEQNISRAFARAESQEAILIIDEADSFLFSRGRAMRSWEISHTNEFLTQMEKFRGILICTTNMLAGLDSASIRRFNHKIEFGYLKPEGNVLFYQRLLEPLNNIPLDETIINELKEMQQLAPGDFKTVRDRFSFYSQSEITHKMLIEALRKESNIKQFQSCNGKRIGF